MSCTFKIKKNLNSTTPAEKQLAQYILDNKEKVISYSAQKLAEQSNTSAATVVRFSKKLGYKGFQELKLDLAKDNLEQDISFDEMILSEDSTSTLLKKAYLSNINTVEQTYKLANINKLDQAITLLNDADTIYLVGVGASAIICQDLMHKLTRLHKKVIFFENFHILIHTLTYLSKKDVLIAISYSGETKEIIDTVKLANQQGTPSIAITQYQKNTLSKISTIVLDIPTEEKEMRLGAISSRFSSLIISDLLYLGLAKQELDVTKEKILKTRKTLKKFNH